MPRSPKCLQKESMYFSVICFFPLLSPPLCLFLPPFLSLPVFSLCYIPTKIKSGYLEAVFFTSESEVIQWEWHVSSVQFHFR